jgi:hypothetical protein
MEVPTNGWPLSFTTLPVIEPVVVVGSSELVGADAGTCACTAVHNSNSIMPILIIILILWRCTPIECDYHVRHHTVLNIDFSSHRI